jgi:hypothetical protein
MRGGCIASEQTERAYKRFTEDTNPPYPFRARGIPVLTRHFYEPVGLLDVPDRD